MKTVILFLRISKPKIRTNIQEFNIAPLLVRVLKKKTSYGRSKYSLKYIFSKSLKNEVINRDLQTLSIGG